jgi:nicotinate phosphoribosyltransferase
MANRLRAFVRHCAFDVTSLAFMQATTALLTDHYELTMLQGALADGVGRRRAVFEVFARQLPPGRRYGVVAGTGRLLDAIETFRFDDASLAHLDNAGVVDQHTLNWLADYRFSGDIWGYAEGEPYFPHSPILLVEGTFAEAVLLETLTLSILNFDSAVAAAASRMTTAAAGRPCIEMGSRRTHEYAAVAAARAAYVAGFESTSNLRAGQHYGVPTRGTSAHAFTLLHDTERDAFTAQIHSLGKGTTLLVDTYDVAEAVALGVEIAGTDLGAVRLDSGDLLAQAYDVRAQLDELGATNTKIVVTSDLDEFAISALAAAPVDGYGVGTELVTGSGFATAGLVYKLVAREGPDGQLAAVEKKSKDKPGKGGRKHAARHYDQDGIADAETISVRGPVSGARYRPLLVPLVQNGDVVGRRSLDDARQHHEQSRAELPRTALQMSRGQPAIPTRYEEQS